MTDKERLEDAKEALKEIDFIKNQRDFKQEEIAKVYFTEKYGKFLVEQAERNLTAQETVEILGESLKQSIEQNKRYRELLESIRYTQDVAKEIQAENPNIKVITPDDLLQHMLRKVNKELESELE